MIKSFITSFKLKNTYKVNSIIYSIKQLPIIKKILPNKLYQNKALKVIGNIISALWQLISVFLGKFLYIFLMIAIVTPMISKTNNADVFLHIFLFLTLIGGLMNTFMFNPTKDKYYAMIIMNMDAKKYTLSNYYYELIKVIIGFLPFTIAFGSSFGIPIYMCILLPIFVVMVKMIVSTYNLYYFERYKIAKNENMPTKILWTTTAILLGIAYGLPLLGININQTIFIITFVISIILGIFSFIKINRFKEYRKMYKQILTNKNVYAVQNQTSTDIIKDTVAKQIELDSNLTSNKKGFAYFHDIFVKRHKKILTEAVKKQAVVIFVIAIIVSIIAYMNKEFSERINGILLTYLPYFVFIMYMLNRGATMTQAMFMNCDHSMLTYRIYRTPKVILGLFKERLKTLIVVNLVPTLIIAIALPVLLFITGGTDNILNYFILFISIIAMSIFFSVHYLVMYYLLQPYNVNTEMKSSTYKVVQTITYFVCWYMIQIQLPTVSFGIATTGFCILYCLISLVLAYKYAPKTFKLRL
ncbi:MAG: hypothetical protein ACLR9X_04170 [Clostridia bacterium]